MSTKKGKPFNLADIDRLDSDVEILLQYRNSRTRMITVAAEMHGMSKDELISDGRSRMFSERRFRIEYLLHKANLSYPQIGKLLKRDHSTILYGVQRVYASLRAAQTGEAA